MQSCHRQMGKKSECSPVQLGDDVIAFVLQGCFALLVRLDLLEMGLDEVVESEALAVDLVLHHEVGKLVDVAGGLQDGLGGQHRAIDFEHLEGETNCVRLQQTST